MQLIFYYIIISDDNQFKKFEFFLSLLYYDSFLIFVDLS